MQTKITARHFELTPEIRAKAEDEMAGLTRYFDNIISAEMVLDAERHRRMAEMNVKVYSTTISGSAETDDIMTAMSSAADKVVAQLKKYKGKLREKRPDEITEVTDSVTKPSTDVDAVDQ